MFLHYTHTYFIALTKRKKKVTPLTRLMSEVGSSAGLCIVGLCILREFMFQEEIPNALFFFQLQPDRIVSGQAGLDGRPLPPIGCRNTLALAHW